MMLTSDQPRADALVLFGATGDLAKRKLFPALYHLERNGRLDLPVIGVARSDWTDESFRAHAREAIIASEPHADAAVIDPLMRRLDLIQGDYAEQATWDALGDTLDRHGSCNAVYYMAIPPSMFPEVATRLASVGLNGRGRIVVEKPFGRDLPSARELNTTLAAVFPEERIFRIDHYLGRRVSKICSCSGSRTPCWSRSGTDVTCAACRSRCRRRSASRAAARSMTASVRSATCSRTTCSRWSRCWRWSLPPDRTPSSSRTRRPR